jgi:hypothetical protein
MAELIAELTTKNAKSAKRSKTACFYAFFAFIAVAQEFCNWLGKWPIPARGSTVAPAASWR